MASDILKQIEKELTEPEVQSTEVSSIPSESDTSEIIESKDSKPVGEEKPTFKPDREESVEKTEKLSRRASAAKESNDKIAKLERSLAERDERDKQNELRYKQLEELSPLAEELKRVKNAEMTDKQRKLLETDPNAAINQLVDGKIQEYLAPMRQQQEMAQKRTFVDQSLAQMREWSGSEENYTGITALLPSFLENVKNSLGAEAAKTVALNPEFAFRYLRDVYNEQNKSTQVVQSQENLKKKQDLANINASISKPNQLAKDSNSKNNVRKEIDNFLLNISGQNRR